jgi:hypothetical protein
MLEVHKKIVETSIMAEDRKIPSPVSPLMNYIREATGSRITIGSLAGSFPVFSAHPKPADRLNPVY